MTCPCRQTVHHVDAKGRLLLPWIRKGDRIVCKVCDRFYGYVVPEKKR